MEVTTTSAGTSETQQPATPATGTPASVGAMPQTATLSLEEAMKRISELEHANKNAVEERDRHRKKLTSYEEAEKKAQEATLSEVERTKKQYTELQATHDSYVRSMQEKIVRYEIDRQASKLGIIDPDAATKLLDWSELEYDDEGSPKNTVKLLETLIKQKPYLVGQSAQSENGKQQTLPAQQQKPPAIPAMNPGRTTINPPNQQNVPGKPMRLTDVFKRS